MLSGLFLGILTLLIMHLLVGILHLTVPFSTAITAEICTIIRYFINSSWVFNHSPLSTKSFLNFHIANFGAFLAWWITANFINIMGVHYLLSSILAVCASVVVSFLSSFFWVWRGHDNKVK
jgi:putative flippase GtrA